MSPVSPPADKRFRRAHVRPGRRRRWRSLLRPFIKYGVLASVTLYALYRGGAVVADARALKIDEIAVRGNVQLSSGAVIAALSGLRGQNILWSDLRAWRERLLASPWVKEAALRRVLPSTIEVVVREREPIGLGRLHGALYLVDDEGAVIDKYGPLYADFDLPIIDGLSIASSDTQGGAVDGTRTELAARLISSLRSSPEVGDRLSQVDVSDARNAAVILSDDPALIYVGAERFLPRLQSYLQLSKTMKERVLGANFDYVDLRFDDHVYVGLAGKARANRAASTPMGQAPPIEKVGAPADARKRRR